MTATHSASGTSSDPATSRTGAARAVRIAILDDYHDIARDSADWSGLPPGCEIEVFDRPLAEAEAADRLAPFHILCTLRERMTIPRRLIERLPNLRHIVVTGLRYDAIDIQAAAERGISVSNCPPGRAARGPGGVVELVWALILSAARRLPMQDRLLRQGIWQAGGPGTCLGGKTLGILGLGQLGRRVAAIAPAFGMEVLAWSPNLTDAAALAGGARRVGREDLFAMSDVLSVHVPLSARSRGLVGAAEIALMKPTAVLVNTARGPIVDEAALIAALRERRIAGAALDVYAEEPLPADHPFLSLDNAVLSPHLGYYTKEALRGYYTGAVENIAAFLAGRPIRLVTPPVAAAELQSATTSP